MLLSDTSIKRPVFTVMIISAIIIFGWISLNKIGVDLFPRVEFPVISIISTLPGADPETLETTVTDSIEQAVSTISGIKNLRSVSADSVSQVIVEFELEKNVDIAFQEVQAKMGTIRSELPKDLEDPVIEKFDIDSAPIISVLVSGPMGIKELTQLADKVIKERLQRILNVGQVKLVGGRDRKIWIWIDRDKLKGYGLSLQEVERALKIEHIEFPGGRIDAGKREYVVKTKGEFNNVRELNELIISYKNGNLIRISDIGRVEDGLEEERSISKLNENKAVSLLIRKQSGTNTVEVSEAVKKEVEQLRLELESQGVRLEIAKDFSTYIKLSIHEVRFHMIFGGGLAIFIVFLFLRSAPSTFISALSLPTSVIGTFMLMQYFGFTQNMMTLLALSLAIGLLIDDAIVVQENIMRHVEGGKEPYHAASFATDEIGLAVLATTLSVVSVFVPVAFMEGIIGRFFYQFGMTVAFSVLISLFVSFTLTPMLSARIVSHPHKGMFFNMLENIFKLLEKAYKTALEYALGHRFKIVCIALILFFLAGFMTKFLRKEFAPIEDQSEMNIDVRAPLGATLSYTDSIIENVRNKFKNEPWLEYTFTTIGTDELKKVNEGTLYVKMVDKEKRNISQADAMQKVRDLVKNMNDAKISVGIVPRISMGAKQADLQMEIRGGNLELLDKYSTAIMDFMRKTPGIIDIDTNYETKKPQVSIYPSRNACAALGVSPLSIGESVKYGIGGQDVSKFKSDGNRYDISLRFDESQRNTPDSIFMISIKNNKGMLVDMKNISEIKTESGPVQINRYNRSRQIMISANLQPDKIVLGEGVQKLTDFIKTLNLSAGYTFGFVGMAEVMEESFQNLIFALFLAVIIIYMVLASQFESFIHPFTIMISLPLSIVGAIGGLILLGKTLNIFTMMGIIMLMGLVTKNAILLIDYTNTLRRRDGMSKLDALLTAGPVRLRPILMTTLAMVFGMLPIALGTGAGSESRSPMATAVIGGLIVSTLLTLIIVPVVYSILDDITNFITNIRTKNRIKS